METPGSEEVLAHLDAENRYSHGAMRPTHRLQERFFRDMYAYLRAPPTGATGEEEDPFRLAEAGGDGYVYYSRRPQGGNFPIYYRRPASSAGKAQECVLLDQNGFPDIYQRMHLGDLKVRGDAVAFSLIAPEAMDDGATLYLRPLEGESSTWWTAEDGAWQGIGGFEWGPSSERGQVLYYTKVDGHGRPHQVWMVHVQAHSQGITQGPALVYELPGQDKAFFLSIGATKDKRFVSVSANSKTSSEVHLLPGPASPDTTSFAPALFRQRQTGVQYFVDHGGSAFFIVTNKGSEDGEYRLMTCPTHDTSEWGLYHHHDHTESSIEDMDLFQDHCVLYDRLEGIPSLHVLSRAFPASSHRPALPHEATGRLQLGLNQDYRAQAVRFSVSSPILPDVTYDFHMVTRQLTELHRETLRGRTPTSSEDYQCQRVVVGDAKVPLTLAHRRAISPRVPAPVLLQAYGAYGVSLDLGFRPELLPLLDRGWVVAFAHVRGGGEKGRRWHAQGKGMHKMNSVLDYLACVEWLVQEGWTQPGMLAGHGASAGALVVAGAVHRHPRLFGAMVLKVPFLDVLRTMTDPSLPLTVHEYDEWTGGKDPRTDARVQAHLKALSPYDSLHGVTAPLPPTLVLASLADHRVRYWEAAKYVAKLRDVTGGKTEVLLRMEGDRAHEAPAAQTDMLHEMAYEAAFMTTRLGLDVKERGEEKTREGKRRPRRGHQYLPEVPPLVFW